MHKILDQISDMLSSLSKIGGNRVISGVSYESGLSKKEISNIRSFNFDGKYVVISQDIFNKLSGPAIKLIIEISQSLKMNNPLWYCIP
jgi:hypothetical protein